MYLGFSYRYFRGFRNLSEESFEILEVVADPEDILHPEKFSSALNFGKLVEKYERQDRLIEEQ